MRWAVAVTTAPRRGASYLADCLASLMQAGWDTGTVFAEPGCPSWTYPGYHARVGNTKRSILPNWRRALSSLLSDSPQADAYLVVQDDATLARGCRAWLEPQWSTLSGGMVSLYTCGRVATGALPGWTCVSPWATPRAQVRFYGAVAVAVSQAVAKQIVVASERWGGLTALDEHLKKFCVEHRVPYAFHVPSLARHIGRVSTLTGDRLAGERRPRVERLWSDARHEGPCVDDVAELIQ